MTGLDEHITFKELKAVRCMRHPGVPPRAQRTTSSTKRRQFVRHRHPHPPHLQVSPDDVRAPQTNPLDRPTTSRSGHIISRAQRTCGQTTCPASWTTPSCSYHHVSSSTSTIIGTPHNRPLRLVRQQAIAPLQRQVARRHHGGSGEPSHAKRGVEKRDESVQPHLGIA